VTEPGRRHAQRAADLGGWGRLCAHQLWRADQADLSLAVYQRVLGSSAAIWWGQRVVARVSSATSGSAVQVASVALHGRQTRRGDHAMPGKVGRSGYGLDAGEGD
jgi:hypothetical protein